jgi:hypothetical protein
LNARIACHEKYQLESPAMLRDDWKAVGLCVRIIVLLGLGVAGVAIAGPRDDVYEIADLIDRHYFDAGRATQVAEALRLASTSGEFDRYVDRDDLVVALTDRLRKIDAHFAVTWQSQPEPTKQLATQGGSPVNAPDANSPPAPTVFLTSIRRSNYGFRRVERLPGNVALIELTVVADIDFSDPHSPERRAADSAIELARDADAVILDLRDNGGGAPSMVGYLVSAFVKSTANVYNVFHSRAGTESERPEKLYPNPLLDVPLYVLTSARTGSAAEAIAFTLQTCGRAKVIGERSAGAANPGQVFRTPRGLNLFVSTGSPKNPINGRNWEGEGVQPDESINPAEALHRAQVLALQQAVANATDGYPQTDAQWALDALRNQMRPYQAKRLLDYTGSFGPFAIVFESGGLQVRRDRRPPLKLIALRPDTFYVDGNPSRQVVFERAGGAVIAMRLHTSTGERQKFNRGQ